MILLVDVCERKVISVIWVSELIGTTTFIFTRNWHHGNYLIADTGGMVHPVC